ncbi:glycosyltransferase family 9 protein [Dolichospermum sp. FACHB-1091]|uniref:glycosyltransferase family 9 protein n=1 Tax=Dolichospermum sp. FACHB-1091 TaxID=2692798 RepID=UPI0016807F35|nr:glycosyltransferase family 9 protein [Dolichospermum sp. FACHB-1091]MBD2443648.1 glycosyltransferase family 9 protein [Dolichospermum sp. FACHB-1091]
MRVVALVPGSIDNQILFFATLDDLKRYYPHAQIDVVVEPKSKAAYRVSKSVHDVLTFDYKDRNSLADWGNFVGMIRDREYDVAIIVGQSWFVGFLMWLTGITTRIGYQGQGAVFLTDRIVPNLSQYVAKTYHDLLKALKIDTDCPGLSVNVPKIDIEWARGEQKRLGVSETGFILINGGGASLDTTYPEENWQQIIEACQQKQPDLPIVVIKEANNEPLVKSLLQSCDNIQVTSPEDIGKLTAIIAGASLMLSVENSYLQLGVAVETYTIALLNSTESLKLLPTSEKVLTMTSHTGKVADISPQIVLEKIWGG